MLKHNQSAAMRLKFQEEHPGEPLPGASRRMAEFDALPPEVRVAIANTSHGVEAAVTQAQIMLRKRKPIPAILKAIARIAEERDNGPAARHVAEAFLKDLDL